MRPSLFLPLLAGLLLTGFTGNAQAGIYTFVDENGIVHFSNVPIDSRYQKMAGRSPRPPAGLADPVRYEAMIRTAARQFALDPLLIKAVIKAESYFDCYAVSKKGALGLMQLMPGTAREMMVSDPFDPEENIRGGTRYLRQLLTMFQGDLRLALAAYNAGPGRVRRLGRIPRIPETVNYVQRVMSHYQKYQAAAPPSRGWARVAYE